MKNYLNDYKNANVLVTGGAGFVGSNLVTELVELGANVTVVDDLFTGSKDNISDLMEDINFIQCDIRDINKHIDMLVEQHYIFHLAARNIELSINNPIEDFEVNIGGTLKLLQLLKEGKNNLIRFIYASSASIYGNQKYLPVNEDAPIDILSPYAASKLGGENYTKVFYKQYDLPVSIVRYSNVYGINQTTQNPYCGVVAKFIENVINDKPLTIFGNGEQTRDFTFVKDTINATLLAGVHPKALGEIFNVATGTETSVNYLLAIISQHLHKHSNIINGKKRDIDNIRRRVINIDKAKDTLNWEPEQTLYQGLLTTINWIIDKNIQNGTKN